MKYLSKKIVLSCILASSLYAGSWEDILNGLDPNETIVDDGSLQTTNGLYESELKYLIQNNDGIAENFSGTDLGRIILTSNDGSILDSGLVSSDDMEIWAEENADDILSSVFGGDPASSMSGQNSAVSTASTTISVINSISTTKKAKKAAVDSTVVSSKTMLASETLTIKDQDRNIDGSSGVLTYSHTMESLNSLGLIINYKYTKADDTLESKTKNIALTPYYRIENSINEKFNLPIIFNLVGNLVYLESTVFPDGAGYLEYGGGVGISPSYKINDSLSANGVLSIQYLEKYIPDAYVPDDAKWLSDAINNLKALQVASYGMGINYQITDSWAVNADILQIKHLVTDNIKEGREKATYYSVNTAVDMNDWRLVLGYKIVEDLKDYEESAYMVSLSYDW